MTTEEAQKWANAATLVELKLLAAEHKILLPPKAKKLEIVELLVKNNIDRPTKSVKPPSCEDNIDLATKETIVPKRKMANTAINLSSKRLKSSQRKILVRNLVQKMKHGLKEPLELPSTVEGNVQLLDKDLVCVNNKIVGKMKNGSVVYLDQNAVERAINMRIDFDYVKYVPDNILFDDEKEFGEDEEEDGDEDNEMEEED